MCACHRQFNHASDPVAVLVALAASIAKRLRLNDFAVKETSRRLLS